MNYKLFLLAISGCLVSTTALAQSGPPTVNANVVNSASNPVPVIGTVNVQEKKMPFLRSMSCSSGGSSNFCQATYAVGSTSRVVIEYVGLNCNNFATTPFGTIFPDVLVASLDIRFGGETVEFGLHVPAGLVFNNTRWYSYGQTVSINAPPGSSINFGFNVTASTTVQCSVGLSGYQVATP